VVGNSAGLLFGAEYQSAFKNFFANDLHDKDVPCAVCESSIFSMTMMIPARTQCYPGWTKAYHGVLTSGAFEHNAASQYICTDDNPQSLDGGSGNSDGKLLYVVKAKCGSLRCPPYEEGKVLSCVVCMK